MRHQHLSPGHLRDAMRALDQALKQGPVAEAKTGVGEVAGA
jgi:hypothetical protein